MLMRCDHCEWAGPADAAHPHPREDRTLCPQCWADGYEADVREQLGPLMEALGVGIPSPRVRKAVID